MPRKRKSCRTTKTVRKKLAVIARHAAKGRCAQASRAYAKLPRTASCTGPTKTKVKACLRRGSKSKRGRAAARRAAAEG